jgi:hypothetical protein
MDLLDGRVSREEVASWAGEWVLDSDSVVDDFVVWRALTELAGADLKVGPLEYLHCESDFHAWLDAIESAPA